MASPIPQGSHSVTPHLIVRNAAKAIDFYKQAFGAEEVFRMAMPDGKIGHAEIKIGDSLVYLADEAPDWGALSPETLKGSPVTIHLYVTNADAAYERATKAGATPTMPLADMFWGDRYGKGKDPFGHNWSIATHVEDVSPEECERRMKQFMAKGG